MDKNKSFVYILQCSDDTLYTGFTTDLQRRLDEHQKGSKKCKYTMAKIRRPVQMVSSWEVEGPRGNALRIEAFIKKLVKSKKLNLIKNPEQLSIWYFDKVQKKDPKKIQDYIKCNPYRLVQRSETAE